jgi:ribonuclease HII
MAEAVKHWCSGWAVGRASPLEIDELGMARALGLASWRALGALAVPPRFLIVDGAIDFVTRGMSEAHEAGFAGGSGGCPGVTTLVGADRTCLTVAAASIVAKVSRDTELRALAGDEPRFGFDRNKGYGTREHEDAIRAHGLTSHHRSSWSFGARLSQEETLLNRPGRSLSRGRIAAHESAAVGPEPPGAVQDAQGGRHRS